MKKLSIIQIGGQAESLRVILLKMMNIVTQDGLIKLTPMGMILQQDNNVLIKEIQILSELSCNKKICSFLGD